MKYIIIFIIAVGLNSCAKYTKCQCTVKGETISTIPKKNKNETAAYRRCADWQINYRMSTDTSAICVTVDN